MLRARVLAGAVGLAALLLLTAMTGSAQADTTRSYQNDASAACLDSNAARDVYVRLCNGGSYQKWIYGSSGSYQLKNLATGYCLDSNSSGSVYALGCNSGNFQKWRRVGSQFANIATGLCLDLKGFGGTISQLNPYTNACNTGAYQRWTAI